MIARGESQIVDQSCRGLPVVVDGVVQNTDAHGLPYLTSSPATVHGQHGARRRRPPESPIIPIAAGLSTGTKRPNQVAPPYLTSLKLMPQVRAAHAVLTLGIPPCIPPPTAH